MTHTCKHLCDFCGGYESKQPPHPESALLVTINTITAVRLGCNMDTVDICDRCWPEVFVQIKDLKILHTSLIAANAVVSAAREAELSLNHLKCHEMPWEGPGCVREVASKAEDMLVRALASYDALQKKEEK